MNAHSSRIDAVSKDAEEKKKIKREVFLSQPGMYLSIYFTPPLNKKVSLCFKSKKVLKERRLWGGKHCGLVSGILFQSPEGILFNFTNDNPKVQTRAAPRGCVCLCFKQEHVLSAANAIQQ